jgi:hypothetical protein
MDSARKLAVVLLVGLTVLALSGVAGAASTNAISGTGLVVEKDVAQGTVTLDAGVVLQVSESTRIVSADGVRITLAELPVARLGGGGLESSPEATIRYEGRLVGSEKVADEIRAGVQVPR